MFLEDGKKWGQKHSQVPFSFLSLVLCLLSSFSFTQNLGRGRVMKGTHEQGVLQNSRGHPQGRGCREGLKVHVP